MPALNARDTKRTSHCLAAMTFPVRLAQEGVPFDRRQAARAWEIAVRLREQVERFGVSHSMPKQPSRDAAELVCLEQEIQISARNLSITLGFSATSLENLIDQLERRGTGQTIALRAWQV